MHGEPSSTKAPTRDVDAPIVPNSWRCKAFAVAVYISVDPRTGSIHFNPFHPVMEGFKATSASQSCWKELK